MVYVFQPFCISIWNLGKNYIIMRLHWTLICLIFFKMTKQHYECAIITVQYMLNICSLNAQSSLRVQILLLDAFLLSCPILLYLPSFCPSVLSNKFTSLFFITPISQHDTIPSDPKFSWLSQWYHATFLINYFYLKYHKWRVKRLWIFLYWHIYIIINTKIPQLGNLVSRTVVSHFKWYCKSAWTPWLQ